MFQYNIEFWNKKYQHPNENIERTFEKIAKEVSRGDSQLQKKFEFILKEGYFLPGGRILAYCGNIYQKGTLMNCFVMPSPEDDIESILDIFEKSILTWKAGGGIGINFSKIRNSGEIIKGTGCVSAGPLGFMKLWNTASDILQGVKYRKGAMLAVLNDTHKDILDFIYAKYTPNKRQQYCYMNISVGITNANNLNYLAEDIAKAMHFSAEPGIIFLDRINKTNNLAPIETIECANPCSEAPLQPYGACCLGSIILPSFVKDNQIMWDLLGEVTQLAVEFLDNVLDISYYPLFEQEYEAQDKRKIGLGFLGLADTLALLRIPYASKEALDIAEEIAKTISIHSYFASSALAMKKEPFPKYNDIIGEHIIALRNYLPESTKEMIKTYGLRNASLTAIAPTGSISQLCGNMSSGIEPIFSKKYTRMNYGIEETIYDYAYMKDPASLIQEAYEIPLEWHLNMVEAVQKYIDGSISKTVNLPKESTVKDIIDVLYNIQSNYQRIKGFTVYRDGTFENQILCKDGACTL